MSTLAPANGDARVVKDRLDIHASPSRYTYGCDTRDYGLISSAFLSGSSIATTRSGRVMRPLEAL
jgi:hypothetical protein